MTRTTSNTNKVIKGIKSQTLVTILLGFFEIASFSIMSRLLSKEDFGYYAAISAVVTVFACFSDTGIGAAIIHKKELTKKYIDNAFTLCFFIGSLVSFALFISSGFLARIIADSKMTLPLMLMSFTLLFNCIASVFISLMQRKLQFLRIGIIQLIALVITTLVAIILAIKGLGYYAIIVKAVMTSLIVLVLTFIYAKTKVGFEFEKSTSKEIVGFSGWLMASVLFRNLAHNVDNLLMSRLLSVSSLGAYSRPKSFIEQIASKFTGIFDTTLFPILSSIQDEYEKLRSAFCKSLYFVNILGLFLTLLFVFNSELIIRLFFGEKWIELKGVVIILSLLIIFNADGRLADCFLRSLGLTRQQFYFRIIETLFTLVGVVWGSLGGVLGVSIGVAVTNMIVKTIKILYISKKIQIPFMDIIFTVFKSWRFAFFYIPSLIATFIVSNSLEGDLFALCLFVISTLLVFVFFPKFVGIEYKELLYDRIAKQIKNHIK